MFGWGSKEVENLDKQIGHIFETLKRQAQINADLVDMFKTLAERNEVLEKRLQMLDKQALMNMTVF